MAEKNSSVLTIGCDPEVFLRHRENDLFVSGHLMSNILGDKWNPLKVENGALQLDGVALEFNINPAKTEFEFVKNVSSVFNQLMNKVEEHNKELIICISAIAKFKPSLFKEIPDHFKQLGCSPDYNAYTQKEQVMPKISLPIRAAGGHIHLGWTENNDISIEHMFDCMKVVKQLDASVYIASLLYDDDKERRKYYGQRGSFRPKPYGVEYRSLSNAWLKEKPLVHWIFNATKYAFDILTIENISFAEDEYLSKVDEDDTSSIEDQYNYLISQYDFPRLPKDYEPLRMKN